MKKCHLGILGLGTLIVGLAINAQALPYTGADFEFKGVEYSNIDSIDQVGVNDWQSLSDGSIYSAWANRWVEYEADLTAGTWQIGLNVINQREIGTGWYSEFEIFNSLTDKIITIPASDTEVNSAYITETVSARAAATYTIRYTWQNDQWDPTRGLDANIQIVGAFFDDITTTPAPEPATMLLFGTGLACLAGLAKKKKNNNR